MPAAPPPTPPVPAPAAMREGKRSEAISLVIGILGVIALAVVVAVIGYSGLFTRGSEFSLTYADIRGNLQTLQMDRPRFTGRDRNGLAYRIAADSAAQDSDDADSVFLESVTGRHALADGGWVAVSAGSGMLSRPDRQLELFAPVRVDSNDGYRLETEQISVNLESGDIATDHAISGRGPAGTLRADAMRVTGRGEHIRFTGGVHMMLEGQRP